MEALWNEFKKAVRKELPWSWNYREFQVGELRLKNGQKETHVILAGPKVEIRNGRTMTKHFNLRDPLQFHRAVVAATGSQDYLKLIAKLQQEIVKLEQANELLEEVLEESKALLSTSEMVWA
ncbi:MAG: hypothetical protein ACE5OZ_23230 [Candidatus Heimdallarchaeota archaeon]